MLEELCGLQDSFHGLSWAVGERNMLLYVDDGWIAGRVPDWVQNALAVTVESFGRVGTETNLDKTKLMVFVPGLIWGQIGKEEYKQRSTGEGATFHDRRRTRVSCSACGAAVAASSLRHHMEISDGVIPQQTRVLDVGMGVPTTYVVSFPRILKLVECPVQVCAERAHSTGQMRENFMNRHFCLKVVVLQ